MEEERLYDVYALDEDIKILENNIKILTENNGFEESIFIKAIEHLIEAYKKQQALIEGVKYEYMPPDVSFMVMYKDDFDRNFGNYYIPKSKVKEKIEELKKAEILPLEKGEIDLYYFAEDVLQELLEEE